MSDLTSKDGAFDIGYPLEEAIADANGWLRGTTMYEGMRGWKAALLVIMADRDRLTAREKALREALDLFVKYDSGPCDGVADMLNYAAAIHAARAALKEKP